MQTELEKTIHSQKTSIEKELTRYERENSFKNWKKRLEERGYAVNISFKLSEKDLMRIDILIYQGIVLTRSEFYRQAIIWKIMDVFPVPDLFLIVPEEYNGIKKKNCALKLSNNFIDLLRIIGESIEGGYSTFIRMSILELLNHYERLFRRD